MEDLAFVMGVIANILSGLVFLSPVGTFRRIVKNGSTEDFDSLPYICTLLNASLWTYYGIIKPGSYLVSTVNGFGVIVETIYIALFLQFAHPKMRKTVVTTKSVEYMPFFLSFFLFLNGGAWTLYSLLVSDWFVGVSNGTGCFLGAVQQVIYAIYRNFNTSKQTVEQLEDQTECLLPPSSSSIQEC
ncbi:unnamed protein product [Withania somnifera]